jgi:O-antigen ligase
MLALAIGFCLPIARLTPIFIALMFLNWLVEGDFKNKFSTLLQNKFALSFSILYILHLIGLAYTSNMDSGLFDLQVKASILMFPLVLSTRPFDSVQLHKVIQALILGAVVSTLIMLIRALYLYFYFGGNNFFYQAFSFLIHPSYLAMYIDFIIVYLLYMLLQEATTIGLKRWIILLLSYFSFIIVLLSSKMGLAITILIFIGFIIYYIVKTKKYLLGISGLLIIGASVVLLITMVPEIKGRFDNAITALSNNNVSKADSESTAVRMLVWGASKNVIKENLFIGVGTGDAKDALMAQYQVEGLTGAYEKGLNAHNTFLQIFVALGSIGFVLLLVNLLMPFVFSFKHPNYLYGLFLLITILNFTVESMLETQAGVMFYAFINSLLCFSATLNYSKKSN